VDILKAVLEVLEHWMSPLEPREKMGMYQKLLVELEEQRLPFQVEAHTEPVAVVVADILLMTFLEMECTEAAVGEEMNALEAMMYRKAA